MPHRPISPAIVFQAELIAGPKTKIPGTTNFQFQGYPALDIARFGPAFSGSHGTFQGSFLATHKEMGAMKTILRYCLWSTLCLVFNAGSPAQIARGSMGIREQAGPIRLEGPNPKATGQTATQSTKENASQAQTDQAKKTAKYWELAATELSRFTDEWKKTNRIIKAPQLTKTADYLEGIPTTGVDQEAINYVKTIAWAFRSIQSHEDLMTHTAAIQDGVKPPWFGTHAHSAHGVYIDKSFGFLKSIGEAVVSRLNARYGPHLTQLTLPMENNSRLP